MRSSGAAGTTHLLASACSNAKPLVTTAERRGQKPLLLALLSGGHSSAAASLAPFLSHSSSSSLVVMTCRIPLSSMMISFRSLSTQDILRLEKLEDSPILVRVVEGIDEIHLYVEGNMVRPKEQIIVCNDWGTLLHGRCGVSPAQRQRSVRCRRMCDEVKESSLVLRLMRQAIPFSRLRVPFRTLRSPS